VTIRRLRIASLLIAFVAIAESRRAEGANITIDPGAVGTSFLSRDFDLDELSGTSFDGATRSLDIMFGGKFLAAPSLSIELFINETGSLGTWPSGFFNVTSYLVDAAGNAVTAPVDLPLNVQMPAQIWPGWDFYLPNGTQYLPATTGYGADLAGAVTPATESYSLISPLLFWGIHFELAYPNIAGEAAIGGRLQLSNFAGFDYPISISPDPVPQYTLAVPEPSTVVLWVSALLLLAPVARRRLRAQARGR
jgi:hypothetical protein